LTVSAVAEQSPRALTQVVYLAALVPKDGQSGLDTQPADTAEVSARDLEVSSDGLTVSLPSQYLRELFYSDCSDDDAAWAMAKLTPQPLAVMTAKVAITPGRFGTVPRPYVVCGLDQVVPPARQYSMAASAGCDPVVEIPRGHSPFISAPAELAAQLVHCAGL